MANYISTRCLDVLLKAITMNTSPRQLTVLIEENKIDVHQLIDFFNESIKTELTFLELKNGIVSPEDAAHTQDAIQLLNKFKKRVEVFCLQQDVSRLNMSVTRTHTLGYERLMNAFKFLLILKEFPLTLDELQDQEQL